MKFLNNALIFIEKILFPPCCLICGKQTKEKLCRECKNRIFNELKISIKCRKNYKHLYLFEYKSEPRRLILDYKFKDKSYLYDFFTEIILKKEKIYGILERYDIIIPVTIQLKRKKQRGYNQSELIAKKVASKIENLKYENNILIKAKNTLPQSSLNRKQREQNVKNVYKIINSKKILNKKIILFDDIYTTGNTTKECVKILKENGAREVLVFTIAKD